MKVGIITFHHSLNCGAMLQAWALQTYLRKHGLDAEIVNYGKIGWPCKYYLRCDSLRHFIGSFYNGFFTFFKSFGIETYRRHLYRRFLRDQMALGNSVKKGEVGKRGYTHLVVGSDQVWHPVINEGDNTYFLADVPDGVKRISYAPSFGVDEFDPKLERKMAGWLARFDALSVREPQGAEIVKRLCGREATVVCDPTLLLGRVEYETIERRPRFGFPEKYIAAYTICGHPWAENTAIEIGKKMGLPVVHLLGGQLARWYLSGKAKRVTALGPAEWLWFMHHAEYVVTNSFHGTVFSLMFHKPFTVARNGRASDARMVSLLDGVGLSDFNAEARNRPLRVGAPHGEATKPSEASAERRKERRDCVDVNWKEVDSRVEILKCAGMEFLERALGDRF